jgi:hypothetical protein
LRNADADANRIAKWHTYRHCDADSYGCGHSYTYCNAYRHAGLH